jgi:hypothetical protein
MILGAAIKNFSIIPGGFLSGTQGTARKNPADG